MEQLLQPTSGNHLAVSPNWEAGLPMLIGWVTVVAYVVGFTGVTGPHASAGSGPHLHLERRNLDMELAINSSADPCASPYAYACGNYDANAALAPFESMAMIARRKTALSSLIVNCQDELELDDLVFEWEPYEHDREHVHTARMLLTAGAVWQGWMARPGLHGDSVALHIWHTDSNLSAASTIEVNNTCVSQLFHPANVTDGPYTTVLYVSQHNLCIDVGELESAPVNFNVPHTAPPDYPTTCSDAARRYAPAAVAAIHQLPAGTLARVTDMARGFTTLANVSTAVAIGGGAGLLPDVVLEGKHSALWHANMAGMMGLLGIRVEGLIWDTAADTVNAFYDPCQNAIFVPAAMVSGMVYHSEFDSELVRGGLGFILAHEVGHAVDHIHHNQTFGVGVVDRMARVSHVPRMVVNHTMAEDVADAIGGRLTARSGTLTRRLVLQFAQVWCLSDPEFTADVHAPGPVRVNTLMSTGGVFGQVICPAPP